MNRWMRLVFWCLGWAWETTREAITRVLGWISFDRWLSRKTRNR